ncbi:ComEA family DNA-binding protein [Marinobacterium rhizophilum]|uniref:Helix-hairpin-helix domain-containing protein n=1 Tax=Marinobacterium rhizophilum TaxID=420402 RepID=A0ABY5HSI6_9GAMM|nr:helix-hairpin-helix domain-containing protein [Marinobacterium rhizophilum]UTW14135.1 helix-hairpin-helix domain-containing protein [Marinobacterium rhizophilum]
MNTRILRALLLTFCLAFLPLSAAQADTLDINTATADQLSSVMVGVGPAKAQAIVDYRDSNGPFGSIDELSSVKGIGPATVDKNRDFISVTPASAK